MKKLKKQQNINTKPWMDFYDKGVPKTIEYPDKMLWELVKDTRDRTPNYLAYEYYGSTATFRKLMNEIEMCARSLKAIGVEKDDIVTICSPNVPQAIILFYAINMIGAISNMLHPLSAEKEIEGYLSLTKSKYMFTIDIACEKVLNVLEKTNLEKIVVFSAADKMNKITKIAYNLTKGRHIKVDYDNEYIISWNNFIDYGYMYDGEIICKRKTTDPAVILFSGGTTGKPKGIVLSNLNFNAETMQTSSMIEKSEAGDSILSIMPIFHALGLDVCIHTPLTIGVKCILIPVFNCKAFGRLIKQYKPNYVVGVPTLFETMINDPGVKEMNLSFIKNLIVGGDTMPPELKKRIDEFMSEHSSIATIRSGYGLTESAGAVCLLPKETQPVGSIGIPNQDMIFKIVDPETLEELNPGETGEIWVSGPNVMIGYLNNEEETKKALIQDKEGRTWLRTGDLGYLDEKGFIYFALRLKRIIISSGYNLYPSNIENVIMKHPMVSSVCVIGVPHPHKTCVPKAFIVLKEQNIDTEEVTKELKKLCEQYLAKYSLPYYYEYRESLPKTMVGKIAYKQLEDEENNKN